MAAIGMFLALVLVILGAGTALRLRRTLRRLREDRFLPSDDRAYFRGQVVRRSLVGLVLIAIGLLIGGYYLSGMDARMDQIADRRDNLLPADRPNRPPDADAANQAERDFARRVGWYWIGILGLVFAVGCLAVFDLWATRRYWLVQYRLIKADHEAKLRRDLAVYRQAKENDRLGRLRGKEPPEGGDSASDHTED